MVMVIQSELEIKVFKDKKTTAGIIGSYDNSHTYKTIKNLTIKCDVSFEGGGIVTGESTYIIIDNCKHYGKVTQGSGGICGQDVNVINIKNCYNYGKVIGDVNNLDSSSGGIIASFCSNVDAYCGGLVGGSFTSTNNKISHSSIIGNLGCFSGGVLCGLKNDNINLYSLTIHKCHHIGDISSYGGGIIGNLSNVKLSAYYFDNFFSVSHAFVILFVENKIYYIAINYI